MRDELTGTDLRGFPQHTGKFSDICYTLAVIIHIFYKLTFFRLQFFQGRAFIFLCIDNWGTAFYRTGAFLTSCRFLFTSNKNHPFLIVIYIKSVWFVLEKRSHNAPDWVGKRHGAINFQTFRNKQLPGDDVEPLRSSYLEFDLLCYHDLYFCTTAFSLQHGMLTELFN